MDKTVHALLAIGIAVLFPVLVLFTVMTAVPNEVKDRPHPVPPVYPTAPNCQISQYDYGNYPSSTGNGSLTTTTNSNCQKRYAEYNQEKSEYDQKYRQYEQEVRQYDSLLKKDNKYIANRAVIALVIAVSAICLTILIRDIKELVAGIVAGSTLTIIGAVSWLFSYMGSTNVERLPTYLIGLSFVVLAIVLFALEKFIPLSQPIAFTPPKPPDSGPIASSANSNSHVPPINSAPTDLHLPGPPTPAQ